jgi:hypothetical protein
VMGEHVVQEAWLRSPLPTGTCGACAAGSPWHLSLKSAPGSVPSPWTSQPHDSSAPGGCFPPLKGSLFIMHWPGTHCFLFLTCLFWQSWIHFSDLSSNATSPRSREDLPELGHCVNSLCSYYFFIVLIIIHKHILFRYLIA